MSELHVDILAAMTSATIAYGREHQPTWSTWTVAGLVGRYRQARVSHRAVARCLSDLRRKGSIRGDRWRWSVP